MPRSPSAQKTKTPRQQSSTSSESYIGGMLPASQVVRICRKAGIKQQQGLVTQHVREVVFPEKLKTLLSDVIRLADYSEYKTVQVKHVEKAVELRFNRKIY